MKQERRVLNLIEMYRSELDLGCKRQLRDTLLVTAYYKANVEAFEGDDFEKMEASLRQAISEQKGS
ncbi:MAG: hypothetical protein AAF420_13190 [Pseudomonadota bacterium]